MQKLGSAISIQFLVNVIPPIFAAPIGSKIISLTLTTTSLNSNSGPKAEGPGVGAEAYMGLIIFCALAPIVAALFLVPVSARFSMMVWAKV
jgi:hypothetical protein